MYFGVYAHCKTVYHDLIHPVTHIEQSLVHLCAAGSAGKFISDFAKAPVINGSCLAADHLCCISVVKCKKMV